MRPASSLVSSSFMNRTTAAIDEYSPPWIPPSRQRCGPSPLAARPRSTGARAPRAARGRSGACGARSSGSSTSGHARRPRVQAKWHAATCSAWPAAGPQRRILRRRRAAPARSGSADGSGSRSAGRSGSADRRRPPTRRRGAPGHEPRHGAQQALRVRMPRVREQLVRRRRLDDPAEVHDGDAVADVPHDRHVVRDQEQRQAELLAQLVEQVQHRRLHRDVERRHRLVGDEQLRLERQRARDATRWRCPPENCRG